MEMEEVRDVGWEEGGIGDDKGEGAGTELGFGMTSDLGRCWGRMELSLGWHWGWEPQRGCLGWGHARLTLRVQQTCQP